MHRRTSLPCAVWLVSCCFAVVGSLLHNISTDQETHGMKTVCVPSLGNQTQCSSGFYREWTGTHRGQCVPCQCSGLSRECDKRTGKCVNCPFDTTGDHCERCREGYYGHAANRTCQACPCPFTWNNFAVACLDIGSDAVECLCKRGYSGSRCERCAHGYYGSPLVLGGVCRPCETEEGISNVCDPPAGGCDSCVHALLIDLEKTDTGLTGLKQQLRNASLISASLSTLHRLKSNISATKVLVGSLSSAAAKLETEQHDADINGVTDDLSQLYNKIRWSELDSVLQNVNGTKTKADDLLPEAESLSAATQSLIKTLSEVKPGKSITLSENDGIKMMEEARRFLQEMRDRSCSAPRDDAGTETQEAQKLLNSIWTDVTVPVKFVQAADSLRELADRLSEARDSVNKTWELNLRSHADLQQLQVLISNVQNEREQNYVLPVDEMTKGLLKNITHISLTLEERKKERETHSPQLDGARAELLKKVNEILQTKDKEDIITKAEEHARRLSIDAAQMQHVLDNTTASYGLLSVPHTGLYNGIIKAMEQAEVAARQFTEASALAFKEVQELSLVEKAAGLKEHLTGIQKEVTNAQTDFDERARAVNTHKRHMQKQKEKNEMLTQEVPLVSDVLRSIRGDVSRDLAESASSAASASNATVKAVTQRLRDIGQNVDVIALANVPVKVDSSVLKSVEQTLTDLNTALPALTKHLKKVENLWNNTSPRANMTESIRRIKDVIEETRSFVNRLSIAMTFNGKSHVELHPPGNLEDLKSFTSVDLLLSQHRNSSPEPERPRRRRQLTQTDANYFVFYLGDKDPSKDYIGMMIRNDVLNCVYKLGGVVHEVETARITAANNGNSAEFDRIVFHRVYQDAEVNITQNFTSVKPVGLPAKRYLPNASSGLLNLDPHSVVFYVGGYPDDFTPPLELRYPGYKGAMKLSFINDNPVCLFNFKRAVNMDKQPYIKIPTSEVSNYYDGTGYRMAFVKEPERKKRRLFKFHTNSKDTDGLLFFIGNKESFSCVFVERGFLMLRGRHAGREVSAQSAEKVSLFNKNFAIATAEQFTVHYEQQQISTDHSHANYSSFYVGGLPAHLRMRHNVTAPALRGCVDHVTADGQIVEYNRTLGVTDGCPVSILGVRTAALHSPLSIDSLFVWDDWPVTFSLGFRTTDRYATILKRSSENPTSTDDLRLSLGDGYVIFNSNNYSLTSHERYSDGKWHYVSAARTSKGLKLIVDNANVTHGQSQHFRPAKQNSQGEKFNVCITNLYMQRFIPADLSSLTGHGVLAPCALQSPSRITPALKKQHNHKTKRAPTGKQCGQSQRGGYQLYDESSWLSYMLPQQDVNYRPHFSLDVKTKSSKGLILHVAGRGEVSLLALYVANGKMKMSLGQDRIIQHKQKSNDGNWHRVELSVEKGTFHLLVDGVRVTDGHLPNNEGSSLDFHSPVYLGSDLKSRSIKGNNIPMNSVTGCVRDFKMNDVPVGEPNASHKTLPCFDGPTETGTYFGGGHVVLDNDFAVGSNFALSFELRPQYLTGLLFHARSAEASLNVYLIKNKVVFSVSTGNGTVAVSLTPRKSLCDGKFHTVTVSKQSDTFKVAVDSVSEEKAFAYTSVPTSAKLKSLYIGGTTKYSGIPVSSPFLGCIRKVKLNGHPVEFHNRSTVTDPVNLHQCPKEGQHY